MQQSLQKRLLFLLVLILLAVGVAGCAETTTEPGVGSMKDQPVNESAAGENGLFTFTVDERMLKNKSQVTIQGSGQVQKGRLRFLLYDPEGQEVWRNGDFGGEYSFNGYYQPEKTGTYRFAVTWTGPTEGVYSLSFQALGLTAWVLLPGLGMASVAVGYIVLALAWGRRKGARAAALWGYMGLGALLWTVTVAVKFGIAALLNQPVMAALMDENALWSPGSLLFYLYIGSLTGWTEVLLTWLVLRKFRGPQADWPRALAFGLGFGAFEALLLGVGNLSTTSVALLMPQSLPVEALTALAPANHPLYGLAPVVERLMVVLVHALCCVLIFYAVRLGQPRWMWLSFLYKTLLDAVAGFAQFWGVGTMGKLWAIEAVIVLFGIGAVWGLRVLARKYPSGPPASEGPAVSIGAQHADQPG